MHLWTSAEAAEYLGIKGANGARTAKRLLLDMGVRPFPLGRGRGLGDRWRPQEIEEALDKLRGKIVQPEPRRAPYVSIVGRSLKEVVRELTNTRTEP